MAKTLKMIYAGGLRVAALYSRSDRRDGPAQRAAKQKASSAAQKRMNQIYSYQKLELLLATNFPLPGSGLVLTLTFDDQHLPGSRTEAQRKMKYFLKLLRDGRRAEGLPEPRCFWDLSALERTPFSR